MSQRPGWQNCPKYKAVSDIPFLTCNAAAMICMVPYTHLSYQITISIDMLQMHDGVSIKKTITPHTVPFFLRRAFHPCTAENGVLNACTCTISVAGVLVNY